MRLNANSVIFCFFIIFSLLPAYILAIVPYPAGYGILRPELICLLTIYWVISSPQYLGLGFAFTVGLLQDLIEFQIWGAHALALTVVAYICLASYQRIKSYSTFHQTLWVGVLIGLHQVLTNWVQGLDGYSAPMAFILVSVVLSTLLWPVLQVVMWRIRRALHWL